MTLLHNYNVSSKTKLNKIIRIEKGKEREREKYAEKDMSF